MILNALNGSKDPAPIDEWVTSVSDTTFKARGKDRDRALRTAFRTELDERSVGEHRCCPPPCRPNDERRH
jgi:hypothetical protein